MGGTDTCVHQLAPAETHRYAMQTVRFDLELRYGEEKWCKSAWKRLCAMLKDPYLTLREYGDIAGIEYGDIAGIECGDIADI